MFNKESRIPKTEITDTNSIFVEDGFEIIKESNGEEDIVTSLNRLFPTLIRKLNVFKKRIALLLEYYENPQGKIEEIFNLLGSNVDIIREVRNDALTLEAIDQDFRDVLYGRLGNYKNIIQEVPVKQALEAAYDEFNEKYFLMITDFVDMLISSKLFKKSMKRLLDLDPKNGNLMELVVQGFDNYSNELIKKISSNSTRMLFSGRLDRDNGHIFASLSYNRIRSCASLFNNYPDNIRIRAFLGVLLGEDINPRGDPKDYQNLIIKQNDSLKILIDITYKLGKSLFNTVGYMTPLQYNLVNVPDDILEQAQHSASFIYDIVNLSDMPNIDTVGDYKETFKFFHFCAALAEVLQAEKKFKEVIDGKEIDMPYDQAVGCMMIPALLKYQWALAECREILNSEGISAKGTLSKKGLSKLSELGIEVPR